MGLTNETPALILFIQVIQEPLSADIKASNLLFTLLTQNLKHLGWNNTYASLVHIDNKSY